MGLETSSAAADAQGTGEAGGVVQPCPLTSGWVELELVGEDDKPIADERYVIVLPDGTEKKGRTDANGFARVSGLPEGPCKISFPDLDAQSHEALGTA